VFHWVLPEGLGQKTITGAGEVQRLAQKPQQGRIAFMMLWSGQFPT
jgi:hypothetical protein